MMLTPEEQAKRKKYFEYLREKYFKDLPKSKVVYNRKDY